MGCDGAFRDRHEPTSRQGAILAAKGQGPRHSRPAIEGFLISPSVPRNAPPRGVNPYCRINSLFHASLDAPHTAPV